jgi:hypothetical protein
MSIPIVAFYQFKPRSTDNSSESDIDENGRIPGFLAITTAPENVEETEKINPLGAANDPDPLQGVEVLDSDSKIAIQKIADAIYEKTDRGNAVAELVITIHGYNTSMINIKNWYREIWEYANCNIKSSDRFVMLGYRWCSENVRFAKNTRRALSSLPLLLSGLLFGGIIATFVSLLLTKQITLLFTFGFFFATLVVALVLLKVVVYFRDAYRAMHFGVPDLVEVIRQLDQAIYDKFEKDQRDNSNHPNNDNDRSIRRVKLNFIAHSMGGFVTTNVVRILSDVFDPASIGEIDCSGKAPPGNIGRVFCLGRLVLASPDIPVQSIITGRANFLRSSLRRFEEAYLFSNEGDLALRVASTAANYFSYPTHSRTQGHRLGNVTVRPGNKADDPQYGVVNDKYLANYNCESRLVNYLEINTVNQAIPLSVLEGKDEGETEIADLFTYFDCTNYCDHKYYWDNKQQKLLLTPKPVRVLSYRLDKFPQFNFVVYLALVVAWLTGKINVHGGYFEGEFSRRAVYELAFVGFKKFVATLDSDPTSAEVLNSAYEELEQKIDHLSREVVSSEGDFKQNSDPNLVEQLKELQQELRTLHQQKYSRLFQELSAQCEQRSIQVAFSPFGYQIDVLGHDRNDVKRKIE